MLSKYTYRLIFPKPNPQHLKCWWWLICLFRSITPSHFNTVLDSFHWEFLSKFKYEWNKPSISLSSRFNFCTSHDSYVAMTSLEQNIIDKFVAIGLSWRNYGSGIWAASEKLQVKWAGGFVVFLWWNKQTACISSVPWNDVKYNFKLWELGNMVFIIRHSVDANPQFWDPCLNGFEQKWFWEVYWNTMDVDALAPCHQVTCTHAIDCWMKRSVASPPLSSQCKRMIVLPQNQCSTSTLTESQSM